MASTKGPHKDFHHRWRHAEYLILLQVNGDHREEACDNVPLRQSLIACVLECARNRGIEVPDAAYEYIHPAITDGIKEI